LKAALTYVNLTDARQRATPGIAATSFRDLGEETRDKLQNLPSHD
jgi:hypothetical protein